MALIAQKSFQQAIIITPNGSWYCAFLDAKLKIITDNKTTKKRVLKTNMNLIHIQEQFHTTG